MGTTDFDASKKLKKLQINDIKDINILLLGETGVGKSTFINAIANYLTYKKFKEAENAKELVILIPSVFNMEDKDGDQHNIKIGNIDKNEYISTGASATQDVKTYKFPIWNGKANIRLIDSPGMGDTRGVEQDDINCENILSYINQIHELHAICFLLKPTNSRITALFEYCVKQILSRLEKSATNNLIFIFTNTRGTNYGPGETLPCLRKVIENIKAKPPHVDIPLNKNVFCFDNEGFRYLAAVKGNNVKFSELVKKSSIESWKRSADECWKMINYIVGDVSNPPLKPHLVKNSVSINEARRLIIQLSQPLAEIQQLINDNLRVLERHKQYLQMDTQSLEQLRKKLYMPSVGLKVTKLTQPVTVCTAAKCSSVYKVGDQNKWHYKQRCHDPCYLINVPKEIIGSPELVNCAAINRTTRLCNKCTCDFSIHMHIYYMTETFEDNIVDKSVQKNITNKEEALREAEKCIKDIKQRKVELEGEQKSIVETTAKFAHFLQHNAITPFNDSYKAYIEYLIIREKQLGRDADLETIRSLELLLAQYEQKKKVFDEILETYKKLDNHEGVVSAKDIRESIDALYKLKHNGAKIKELFKTQKTSRTKEHDTTEYVHKITFTQTATPNTKTKDEKPKKQPQQKKNRDPPPPYETVQTNKSPGPSYGQGPSRSDHYPRHEPGQHIPGGGPSGPWQSGPPGHWQGGAPGHWQGGAPGHWQGGAPGPWNGPPGSGYGPSYGPGYHPGQGQFASGYGPSGSWYGPGYDQSHNPHSETKTNVCKIEVTIPDGKQHPDTSYNQRPHPQWAGNHGYYGPPSNYPPPSSEYYSNNPPRVEHLGRRPPPQTPKDQYNPTPYKGRGSSGPHRGGGRGRGGKPRTNKFKKGDKGNKKVPEITSESDSSS